MSGLLSVTGLPDVVPGSGPINTGPSITDFIASQSTTSAIVAARYLRDTPSQEGRHIDISLLETTIPAQPHYVSTYLATHVVPQRRETEGNGSLPSQAFPCVD